MKKKKNIDWSLAIEKWYPFIFAMLLGIVYLLARFDIKDDVDAILSVVIEASSILIGFLSALLALLLGLNNNKIAEEVFGNRHYKNLMKNYFEISIGAGFILIALTGSLYIRRTIAEWSMFIVEMIKFLWIVVTVFFFVSAYRVISVVMRIAFFDNQEDGKVEDMTDEEKIQYEELKKRKEIKRKKR